MTAVAHGQKEAMDELISKGAKVEKLDREGKSIIFLAAEYNKVAVLKVTVLLHYLDLPSQSPCQLPLGTHIRKPQLPAGLHHK